jgi:hypothetical protein
MSVSFWIFLIAAILSCIPPVLDHGETLKNFRSSNGSEKRSHGLRLFLLWAIPVFFLIATIISEMESETAAKNLAAAIQTATNAQADAKAAKEAAEPKPLKQRLIDCLNGINNKIIPALRAGQTHFSMNLLPYQNMPLQALCNEPGAKQYIIFRPDPYDETMAGVGQFYIVSFDLNPSLLKP